MQRRHTYGQPDKDGIRECTFCGMQVLLKYLPSGTSFTYRKPGQTRFSTTRGGPCLHREVVSKREERMLQLEHQLSTAYSIISLLTAGCSDIPQTVRSYLNSREYKDWYAKLMT